MERMMNAFLLSKRRALGVLLTSNLLLPGPLTLTRPWLCSRQALVFFLGFLITLINFLVILCGDLRHERPGPGPKDESCGDVGLGPGPGPPPESENFTGKPSVVVDLAMSTSRYIGFVVNLGLRVAILLSFPKIRAILHCLQTLDGKEGGGIWGRGWAKWTTEEKTYLFVILVSHVARALLILKDGLFSVLNSSCTIDLGTELLLFLHLGTMSLLSLDSVLEIATFLLLTFMATFSHALSPEPEAISANDKGRPDKVEAVLSAYFHCVPVWRHASFLTGSLTLLLFLEHVINFCLNVFMFVAGLSKFGFHERTLIPLVTASVFIPKLIAVAGLAQRLQDATLSLWLRASRLSRCPGEVEGQVLSYLEGRPLTLDALGYFHVSRSALISIAGLVVTYIVVLVQFHVATLQQKEE